MKKILAMALVGLCALSHATMIQAKGSSQPQASGENISGFIPWGAAQRMIQFDHNRNWNTTEGEILVCPYSAEDESRNRCLDKKTGLNAWMLLTNYKIAGYEIAGVSYVFTGSGGARQLMVYYRLITPTVLTPPSVPAIAKDPSPTTIQIDRLTIQANTVRVKK